MNIEQFIEFIRDFVNEELSDRVVPGFEPSKMFLYGHCYDFTKIIKHFYKDAQIYINKKRTHSVVKINEKLYDITGEIKEKEIYELANEEDFNYMEEAFGTELMKNASEYFIEELEKCNIKKYLIDTSEKIIDKQNEDNER